MKHLILLSLLLTSPWLYGSILTIVADEWYPMNGEPNSEKPGYMIEMAQTLFAKEGIEVQYLLLPWDRAVKQTRDGKYNCVVGAYKSDTPDFVFPKTSWGIDAPKFFILKPYSWRFDGTIDSLKLRKLGVIEGYKYRDDFDEYVKNTKGIHVQIAKGDHALEINIRKLLANRIDTIVESESVFRAKLKQLDLQDKFQEAGSIIDPVPMYIACSPNQPNSENYIRMVDHYTMELRKSGKLKMILERYGLRDWQQP